MPGKPILVARPYAYALCSVQPSARYRPYPVLAMSNYFKLSSYVSSSSPHASCPEGKQDREREREAGGQDRERERVCVCVLCVCMNIHAPRSMFKSQKSPNSLEFMELLCQRMHIYIRICMHPGEHVRHHRPCCRDANIPTGVSDARSKLSRSQQPSV